MTSYTWTGNARNGLFSFSQNWAPFGGPPAQDDDGSISNGDTVEIDQPVIEVGYLTVDNGTVDDNGYVLIVDNDLTIGTTSGTASLLTVESGQVDFTNLFRSLASIRRRSPAARSICRTGFCAAISFRSAPGPAFAAPARSFRPISASAAPLPCRMMD